MNINLKQTQGSPILSFLLGAGGLVLLVLGLRTAANILNPILLALIFAFAFRPLLTWLLRKGLPTWLAFLLTILIVFVGVLAVALFLAVSIDALVTALPSYQTSAGQQESEIESWLANQGINIKGITKSVSVSNLFPFFGNLAKAVAETLSGMFMMLFILAFMLFETMSLPRKMASAKVTSNPFVRRFANFGADIRKYVTVLTGINFLIGAVDAIFLFILGVDYPVLWGVIAWLLGYIPSVGFWLALIPPFLLAYAEFGIDKALLVLVGYVLINGSVQNVIQPKLMGDAVNLSPLAVVASLFIWTWIIGPMGALLAVPLTMAVQKLVLEPFDSTQWLAELMGAGLPLTLEEGDAEPPPE